MLLSALSIGTVAQWLTVASIAAVAWILIRGGGGGALQILETSNRVLEARIQDQERTIEALTRKVADLEARTDVSAALRPLLEWTHSHELRDQERFERTLASLERIASSVNATPAPAV